MDRDNLDDQLDAIRYMCRFILTPFPNDGYGNRNAGLSPRFLCMHSKLATCTANEMPNFVY